MPKVKNWDEQALEDILKELQQNRKKDCNDCRVAQEGLTNYGELPIVCQKCITNYGVLPIAIQGV
jgi:hypothetical protein